MAASAAASASKNQASARTTARLEGFFSASTSEMDEFGNPVALWSSAWVTPWASLRCRSISASVAGPIRW
ncbi:MAG: hypothetical protein M3552_01840 [Planctomycetota bacterium]|nr:hypothetical protein [Planctomycetota bacterium]